MNDSHVSNDANVPKVRVLIPLWGERYIDDFVRFALPSLLAPGNLPLMARSCRVTVVFLTARKNFGHFRQQPAINAVLTSFCEVEFIPIDDLIQGVVSYAVPLTLAYLRGMTETGEDMTRTYFLCYNSDFILADGSLKPVLRHILDGRSVILAPSFRVMKEAVGPFLSQHFLRPDGQFSMPPREMARLAFKDIHPTVLSRIVNQDLFHSYYPNQIYWRVDANTILARFYLIMQFCIRPERRVESINNFVDYAFLPEMCPSGDKVAIADSEEFFMMELQPTEAENEFIRPGPSKIRHVAKSLSDWTTRQHREISRFELVFHTEDLPEYLPAARKELGEFMEEVEKQLDPQPVLHDSHHYWPGAIESWLHSRQKRENFDEVDLRNAVNASRQYPSGLRYRLSPPELKYYFRIQRWRLLLLGVFWGLPPHVRLWHPQWLNFREVRARLRRADIQKGERILYVADETDFDGFFGGAFSVDKILPRDLLGGFLSQAVKSPEDRAVCFIHLTESNARLARQLVRSVHKYLPRTRRILLYVGQNLIESGLLTVKYTMLSTLVSSLDEAYPGQVAYRFMGGIVWERLLKLFQRVIAERSDHNWFRNFAYVIRLLLGSSAVTPANIWGWLWPVTKARVPRGCTGMLAEIHIEETETFSEKKIAKTSEEIPVVAIFGATGFIGGNLLKTFLKKNPRTVGAARKADHDLLFFDLADPDIQPLELIRRGVTHAVITAGVSRIAECERDPVTTRKINVEGTVELAKQLCANGIKVIVLSSDYVFDGARGNYTESMSVSPVNEYGRQKAEMERLLIEACGDNVLIIRLSKVFDLAQGSRTLLDEMAGTFIGGKTVSAARDQFFCPIWIEDVVDVIGRLILTDASGIMHLCGPHKTSRLELARSIAESFDIDPERVKDISLRDLGENFVRPLDTSMVCDRLGRFVEYDFKAIHECIRELKANYQAKAYEEKK